MSLYNLLHGHDPNAAHILHALGLQLTDIERFRDASFTKDGDAHVFHILCRTGGGNRVECTNSKLTQHPLYLHDHDDAYDCTYAHYYFRIPQAVLDQLSEQGLSLDDVTDQTSLKEKTENALQAMKESL